MKANLSLPHNTPPCVCNKASVGQTTPPLTTLPFIAGRVWLVVLAARGSSLRQPGLDLRLPWAWQTGELAAGVANQCANHPPFSKYGGKAETARTTAGDGRNKREEEVRGFYFLSLD